LILSIGTVPEYEIKKVAEEAKEGEI
jgi:hypothetical protein